MKRMKYILSLLLAISCGPDNSVEPEQIPLSLDRTALEFTADGGEQTFTVTASEQIFLVPGDGWLTAVKGGKDADSKTVVTVTVQKNTVAEMRQTRISVVAGEEKQYVDVTQEAADPINGGNGDNDDDDDTVIPENDGNLAWQFAERLGIGWNLGNHFDAQNNGVSGETFWGNPKATATTFTKVKEAGFNTVRIPVTWMGHIGEAPDYEIEAAWLDRVAEVVGYAEAAGLNAIINMHHDGADSKYWLDIKGAAADPDVQKQLLSYNPVLLRYVPSRSQGYGQY